MIEPLKEAIGKRVAVVRLAKPRHWEEARSWLLYTLFGGLLPFWGTALILLFIGRSQPFADYFASGELAVFCAGLLATAIPTMRRRVADAPVEHPEWFHFAALVALAVILILFASVTLARRFGAADLNVGAIIVASFVLFGSSVTMGFFVELTNNVRFTPEEAKAMEDQRAASLDAAFTDALGGEE